MHAKPWHYLVNTFLVVTTENYKKALVIGADHVGRLTANQSDPVIAAMLAAFDPVWKSYKATELHLRMSLGEYKGKTQTVKEMFAEMNALHLPSWEVNIHVQFAKSSTESTALLPRGRTPFQSGTYVSRIQEIKALGQKCAAIPALQPLSVTILAFHVQVESARQLQQSSGEGQVAALRSLRETARVTLCEELFRNLGLLMGHHKADPTVVANYFDLTLLRRKVTSSNGTFPPDAGGLRPETG